MADLVKRNEPEDGILDLLRLWYADMVLGGTAHRMTMTDNRLSMAVRLRDIEAANVSEKGLVMRQSDDQSQQTASAFTSSNVSMASTQFGVLPTALPKCYSQPHEKITTSPSASTLPSDDVELPPQKYSKPIRDMRWIWMTIYQRLCLMVFVPNIVAIVWLAIQYDPFHIPLSHISTAVAANATAAIIMRQELVINWLFRLAAKCPRSAPLRIRRLLAKVYHFGGIHSGAGIATTVWFTMLNATLLWRWQTNSIVGLPQDEFHHVLFLTILIDVLLILMVVFAHPELRRLYHNAFEGVHRFAGWSIVVLFWIHVVELTAVQEETTSDGSPRPLGAALVRTPAIYLLLIITVSLIVPWLRLRRVPVQVELLSDHASRWHFSYTNVKLCSANRVTDKPLKEWHSFAAIPDPDDRGFSVIVSNAGDWTSRLIQNPPKKLWVRGVPTFGVLHMGVVFNSLVLVATGSGIGPILSLLTDRSISFRILWSARDPVHTYSKDIMDKVFAADQNAVVLDTSKFVADGGATRRPDLLRMSYGLYRQSSAEAVFVISNQKVTEKLIFGLESRGVPAFAPIFDS